MDGIMQKVAWGPNDQSTWHTDYNMRGDAYLSDYKKRLEKAQEHHDEQLHLLDGGGRVQ